MVVGMDDKLVQDWLAEVVAYAVADRWAKAIGFESAS